VTIHTDSPAGDLSRLRIDRDAGPRRPWVTWAVLAILVAAGVVLYPSARAYVAERRAPEVEIGHATQVVTTAGGSTDLPVLVASVRGRPAQQRRGREDGGRIARSVRGGHASAGAR
jgi:hypothetical protein